MSRMTSVSPFPAPAGVCVLSLTRCARAGLISQVAEELWEVKDRKIKNLTKEDITIVDHKNMLVKNSPSFAPLSPPRPSR